jgi:hypothetical protein
MALNDDEQAEAEKVVRVGLKHAGYEYPVFWDEMRELGFDVDLYADLHTYTLEVVDEHGEVVSEARMSRFTHQALHRAARQIRAELTVEGVLEPWERHR